MSTRFTVTTRTLPSLETLLNGLRIQDVKLRDVEPDAPWPADNGVVHFYIENRSTRATEVHKSGTTVSVRVLALASPDDWGLALELIETLVAEGRATSLEEERLGKLSPSELRRNYSPASIERESLSGAGIVFNLIRSGRGPITIHGPRRAFVVGPRLMGALSNEPSPERALLERLRRVQWIEEEGYRPCGIFLAGKDAEEFKFAVLLPDEDLFIPDVDRVLVGNGEIGEPAALLSRDRIPELLGEAWQPIDEVQGCLRAVSPETWRELMLKARSMTE